VRVCGAAEKKKEKKQRQVDGDGDVKMEEEEEQAPPFRETAGTRVILRILNHLEPCLLAKERGVRYRTAQFIALVLSNSLATFPTDYCNTSRKIFQRIRETLTKRLHDKEAIVRVQAIIGVARLFGMGVLPPNDDGDNDDEEKLSSTTELLIEIMQNDPSAYV
jgi:condensin complex subunit 3